MWDGHTNRFREIFSVVSAFNSRMSNQDPIDPEQFLQVVEENAILASESLSNYLEAALEDSKILLDRLHAMSRYSVPTAYLHNLQISVSDYLSFDAFICTSSPKEVQIVLSLGIFLALEDLFWRLASSMDFFSFDPSKGDQSKGSSRQWHGCECFWLIGGVWSPNHRYYDYRIAQDFEKLFDMRLEQIRNSFLSAFHSSIPFEPARLILSSFMVDVGILWILMHEEAHYTQGHLALLESIYGDDFSKLMLGEIDLQNEDTDSIPLNILKAMEFQADCVAAHAIVDIFCREEVPITTVIPDYCDNKLVWFLRLLFVAVGGTVLILQKAHSINGSSENYPLPLTRLTTIFRYVIDRVKDPSKIACKMFADFSDFDFNCSITGALDDLQTISSLLTREKSVEKLVQGEAPIFKKTHDLGILDEFDPKELEFLSIIFTEESILLSLMSEIYEPSEAEALRPLLDSFTSDLEIPIVMLKNFTKKDLYNQHKFLSTLIEDMYSSTTVDKNKFLEIFDLWFSEYFTMEQCCYFLKKTTVNLIPIKVI